MDRLGALRIFVRAAEVQSFVAAGRELGLTASAVGKAIARLEERLGARLLARSTHRVALTAEGTLFLARSRRILAEYEAAEAELGEIASGLRGALRIGAPAWATMLGTLFARFAEKHPGVRLEVEYDDRLADVIGERYDVVFRTGTLEDSALVSRLVGRFEHAIVAAPAYLRRHGTPVTPGELGAHRCLQRRRATDGKVEPWPVDVELPEAGMIVSTVEGRVGLALAGGGIACVPAPAVREHVRAGRLVRLLEGSVRPVGKLHAVWPRRGAPLVRALLAIEAALPGFR